MKLISIVFISLNIWQIISSDTWDTGYSTGPESGHQDHSSLLTSIGRSKQLAKCEIETEFLLSQEAWCGACIDDDMLDDFKKMSACITKRAPHIGNALSEIGKMPIHECKAAVMEFATNLSLHDPAGFKISKDCYKLVKPENLGKCSIQQFYHPAITVFCGETKDKEIKKDLKIFSDCLSKEAPITANEILRIKQDSPDVNTCVESVKIFGLELLLSQEKEFVILQQCSKLVRLEPVYRHFAEEKLGPTTRFVCALGCKDPAVEEELKKALACSNEKIPFCIVLLSNLTITDPDVCFKQIIDYNVELALREPDSFQIVLNCLSYIDQSKLK